MVIMPAEMDGQFHLAQELNVRYHFVAISITYSHSFCILQAKKPQQTGESNRAERKMVHPQYIVHPRLS